MTITRQLLPAERWVPRRERWVPPPRGPNGGCRALMWGSWAEMVSVAWVGELNPPPNPRPPAQGHTTKTKPPRVAEPWTRKLEGPVGSSTVSTTSAGPPAAVGPPGSSSHTSTSTKSLRREVGRGLWGDDGGSAPGWGGGSPRPVSAAVSPRLWHCCAPVALALLRQHGAASLAHRHPVSTGGAVAGVEVRVGAECHAAERHPRPAPQRGTPGVELRERHLCHPEPQKPGDSCGSGKPLSRGARRPSWGGGLWTKQRSHQVPPHLPPPSPSECLGDAGSGGDGGADLRR